MNPLLWTRRRIAISVSLLLVLALAVDAFVVEPRRLVVRRATLQLDRCPAALDGLKIVAIGDIHAGSPGINEAYLDKLVRIANQQKPDLIVLLGDYVVQGVMGGKFVAPAVTAEHLKQLQCRLGTYAVLGNHDVWYDTTAVRDAFENAGIPVLENSAVEVKTPNGSFWLAGIGEFRTGHANVSEALAIVPSWQPVIAITHNPDVFPLVPSRVVLTIAAHTHGGQVNVPLIGRPAVPSHYGARYAIGHIRESGHDLFVTSGVGTSIIPVRFRVPPEITVLKLATVK